MLSILIPAYNEADSIEATISSLREVMNATRYEYEIIVIDDGSSDDTAARAEATGVRLIRHPINGGYGRALKTGMREAKHEWCAIIDADGSYPIDRLPDLIAFTPRFDMVVGQRTGKNFWGSRSKRLARIALTMLVEFVAGVRVPDVNSGMRVFRKEIALAHSRRISSGFSFTTTLTLAVLLDEGFVHWEPIAYHERVGHSKVHHGIDGLRMFQIVVQAVIFYNPLKIFIPICLAAVAVGTIGAGILAFFDEAQAVVFFGAALLTALVIGAVGFVVDALRLHGQERER